MINKQRLINTFCDLVKIDSPSGEEDEIASFLSKRLTELGFNILTDNYGNIIAKQGEGNTLMLSAHMDTVEPGRNIHPWSLKHPESPGARRAALPPMGTA